MDVEIRKVRKSYGKLTALREVSLSVGHGELFGVIGPDGAGKSTLFRILTTLLVPDEGDVRVLNYDVVSEWSKLRPLLGYMPGRFSLYPDLSVIENLKFFASIFGVSPQDNYDLIRPVYRQLEPFEDRRAADLSGGMKQKLALSCALVHRPRLLVLDEPTTGVDAVSRNEFWEMLGRLKEEGITIVVATPYMDEAGSCDRVALMQQGRLLQVDSPRRIAGSFDKGLFAVRATEKYKALKALKSFESAVSVHPFGDSIHVATADPEFDSKLIDSYLRKREIRDAKVVRVDPTIEDRFMDLMQQEDYENGD